MSQRVDRNIAVTIHGRYLLRAGPPERLLIGFHGYAESADHEFDRLVAIPGAENWTVVSVQGLHRFYRRRSDEVVASWMTRQDRELMITDNVGYVSRILDEVGRDSNPVVVFAGFSQGVAMAFRAGCLGRRLPSGVVACGGDVPPEIESEMLRRIPRVLLGRGRSDHFYVEAAFHNDVSRLRAAGVAVEPVEFEGAHEWTTGFANEVARFLGTLR